MPIRAFAWLMLMLVVAGCSIGQDAITTSGDLRTGTIELSLNEGYDFGLQREVTTQALSDIYLSEINGVPTLQFLDWATLEHDSYASVTSVNVNVTPKLSSISSSFIALHLPNVTILSQTQDTQYVKYQITETTGVEATESGFIIDTDDFSYVLNYTLNTAGLPEF